LSCTQIRFLFLICTKTNSLCFLKVCLWTPFSQIYCLPPFFPPGSSSHSLRTFYTLVLGSNQDVLQYIVVAYVDDQLVSRFDLTTRRMLPQVPWLLNVKKEDLHIWDFISQRVSNTERSLKKPPLVKVSRRIQYNGMETLVCRVYGFYPKEMDATWRKDGEVWEQDTFRGGVLPNSDRTYHAWLSIEVDPKERDLYRCYVVHAGVPEPLTGVGLAISLNSLVLPLPCSVQPDFALPQFPPQPMEPHSHSLSAVRLPPWIQTRTGA
uniref:Ig-like domain-containing protein n=1 Tax=Naja naja TaxID=35670 RepID=A0A8C6VHR7_NAJNA